MLIFWDLVLRFKFSNIVEIHFFCVPLEESGGLSEGQEIKGEKTHSSDSVPETPL